MAQHAAVGLLTVLGLAISLASCGPDASDGGSPLADRSPQPAGPNPTATAVAAATADAQRAPPTATAQPTPTEGVHRDPEFGPTTCAPGGARYHRPWHFTESVQWTPDGGSILFTRRANLYAVAADGSRLWQVAESGTVDGRPHHPIGTMTAFAIAPDGGQVIYSTCRYLLPETAARRAAEGERIEAEDYEYELARVQIDGTGHQRLTENRILDNHPAWSPDGRRIAFLAGGFRGDPHYQVKPQLYAMAPDGSDRRLLRTGVVAPLSPLWSPDGEYLAYVKSDGKKAHIYTYAIGGTKSQRLTEAVSRPAWSPDGQRIAFAKPDGDGVALYTIAADGTDAQRVTTIEGWRRVAAAGRFREPDDELDPAWAFIETVAWSPSGEHILHTCDPTICVVSLDGTPVGQAPVAPIAEKRVLVAAWSPDGSRIALTHPELPHPMVLYTMAPDGTDVQVLVEMGDVGLVAAQASAEDAAASRAACQAGFVVHDPAANPGLVRDCEVLLELRDALFQGRLVNWGSGAPIGQWVGVTVGGAPPRVTGLALETGGPLSPALAQLSQLRTLHVEGFMSPIPPELGQLAHLRELTLLSPQVVPLSSPQFAGSIPPELGQLANLQVLELSSPRFTGPIPPELGNLVQLQQLTVVGHQLTGGIPPRLGDLVQLQQLTVVGHQLTGGIPPELGNLAQLRQLFMTGRLLTGGIPPELGNLVQLQSLIIPGDGVLGRGVTGPIPAALSQLANLERLHLGGNQLTGAIPPALGQLVSLRGLDLSRNQLTGSIPAELGQLANLEELRLRGNRLTGCIPVGLPQVRRTDVSDLGLPDCDE